MEKIIEQLHAVGIVPVVKIEDAEKASPMAQALKKGGICCAEITFRTEAAEQAIRNIAASHPEFLIIAGTVLTEDQADRAMKAGATALVSPGFDEQLVAYCQKKHYPIIPGVCNASEIARALRMGLKYLKFFPAEQAGGVAMIKALAAPYGMVRFMPTGGINAENVGTYLKNKSVFACGGSWLVPSDAMANGDFKRIEDLTREACERRKEIQ